MKTIRFASLLVAAALSVIFSFGSGPASAKPLATQGAPKLTKQQSESLHLAWKDLARAYQDLMSAAPDVKGDTSRLEAALKSAVHDLHQMDPALEEVTTLQAQDRGVARDRLFDAVQRHLDSGKKYIQAAKVQSPDAEHALGQIAVANTELRADRAAPAKTAAVKTPVKK
jgi:hypothetical protein